MSLARRRVLLVVMAAVLVVPLSASGGWINEIGRDLGLGWSDGYHAYEGCPDSRLRSQPWQRRANRSGGYDEPLVPYLERAPSPSPTPAAGQPMSRIKSPAASQPRTSQLHISRPNY
jgi:hypothetical protein